MSISWVWLFKIIIRSPLPTNQLTITRFVVHRPRATASLVVLNSVFGLLKVSGSTSMREATLTATLSFRRQVSVFDFGINRGGRGSDFFEMRAENYYRIKFRLCRTQRDFHFCKRRKFRNFGNIDILETFNADELGPVKMFGVPKNRHKAEAKTFYAKVITTFSILFYDGLNGIRLSVKGRWIRNKSFKQLCRENVRPKNNSVSKNSIYNILIVDL